MPINRYYFFMEKYLFIPRNLKSKIKLKFVILNIM